MKNDSIIIKSILCFQINFKLIQNQFKLIQIFVKLICYPSIHLLKVHGHGIWVDRNIYTNYGHIQFMELRHSWNFETRCSYEDPMTGSVIWSNYLLNGWKRGIRYGHCTVCSRGRKRHWKRSGCINGSM